MAPVTIFFDGRQLVQGRLAAWYGHSLAYTHFTPGRWVHHWGIVRGTGLTVGKGPEFLGPPCRRRRRRHSAIVLLSFSIIVFQERRNFDIYIFFPWHDISLKRIKNHLN